MIFLFIAEVVSEQGSELDFPKVFQKLLSLGLEYLPGLPPGGGLDAK